MIPTISSSRVAILGVAFALGVSVQALELGRSRVVSNATVRVDYDSNILLNQSEVEDLIASTTLGTRLVHDASVLKTEAGITAHGYLFADHDENNAFDPGVDGRVAYAPSDKTDFMGKASYARQSQPNEALNDRAESNELLVEGSFRHLATEKLGYRFEADYRSSDYRSAGYSDVKRSGFGADVLWQYSPKLQVFVGLNASTSETRNRPGGRLNAGGDDTRFTVGFEGDVSAKVTGFLRVGVVRREFEVAGRGSDEALFVDTQLHWEAAEKSLWVLSASQDFGVTAVDQSSKSFNLSLSLTHDLSEKVSLESSVGYTHAEYTSFTAFGSRTDEGANGRLRLNYTLRSDLVADVSLGYRNIDSTLGLSSYDQLTCGAGLSYRF